MAGINIRISKPVVNNGGGGSGGGGGDGATGPTGPSGLSAYEIAVIEGFSGTEQEWLASLVGQDGATGADSTVPGPTGATGQQGIKGEDGQFTFVSATVPENGVEGNSWFNSSNGQIYIYYDGFWIESASSNIGPQGDIGATGPTGSVGATGPAGEDGQFTFISATAPENATEGDSWFNSSNGQIYIYYDSFWVESASSNIGPAGPTGPEGEVEIVSAPTTPTAPGETGQVAIDENYIYICTAPNTWVRATREAW